MTDLVVGYLVIALATALLLVSLRLRQAPTFPLVLLARWLRWTLFGLGAAYLVRDWGGSGRPYWALAPSFLLLWILLESIYTWLIVRALSLSSIPVYPVYRISSGEVSWPVAKEYLRVKEEIKSLGFDLREKLAADLGGEVKMASLLYTNKEGKVRLQVIFAPRANGHPAVFFAFSSFEGERRWITDNVWLPFGGVFPKDWVVSRKPFVSSPAKLFGLHQRLLEKSGETGSEYEKDSNELVDGLNEEQQILDRESTERGILVPRGQRPQLGKLTGDGRYRVWKQILLLNYLGRVGRKNAK